eukprot:gene27478-4784_t
METLAAEAEAGKGRGAGHVCIHLDQYTLWNEAEPCFGRRERLVQTNGIPEMAPKLKRNAEEAEGPVQSGTKGLLTAGALMEVEPESALGAAPLDDVTTNLTEFKNGAAAGEGTSSAPPETGGANGSTEAPPETGAHLSGTAPPNSNFLKGVHWSPDGSCLLTACDDNWFRIFDLPQDAIDIGAALLPQRMQAATESFGGAADSLSSALRVQEGETIYDYAWYPGMSALDPVTCCFASTARAHPIHLWDACTGALRCTYRGYNDVDEVWAAYSVLFNTQGTHVYGGPGREYRRIHTQGKKSEEGKLPGIVSCMAASTDSTTLAAGTYSGCVGLYDARSHEALYILHGHKGGVTQSHAALYILHGHKGGVTQVKFSHDGNFLFSGARQDPDIIVWDVRQTSGEVYRLQRDTATTNQRIQFDVEPCGRHLATGGCNGSVKVFDLTTGEAKDEILVSRDAVNGVDFHPFLNLMAVSDATSWRPADDDDDDDVDADGVTEQRQASSDDEDDEDGVREQRKKSKRSQKSVLKAPPSCNMMRVLRLGYDMIEYGDTGVAEEVGEVAEASKMVEYGETGVAEEVAEVAEESEIGIEGPALLQHEGLAPRV